MPSLAQFRFAHARARHTERVQALVAAAARAARPHDAGATTPHESKSAMNQRARPAPHFCDKCRLATATTEYMYMYVHSGLGKSRFQISARNGFRVIAGIPSFPSRLLFTKAPSTAPCERLVSTHARRPPMTPPGMASRGPPPGQGPRTFLAHHRARLSQRPSFSRTRLHVPYHIGIHVSLAAPAMSFKLTVGMSPF